MRVKKPHQDDSRLIRAARRIERDYYLVAEIWADILERWMDKEPEQQRAYLSLLHPNVLHPDVAMRDALTAFTDTLQAEVDEQTKGGA